jgi:adenylate cyclase
MKRSALAILIIGAAVTGVVIALQLSGLLLRVEFAISDLVSRHAAATTVVAEKWQYLVIAFTAFTVAWFAGENSHKPKVWWVVAALLVEIVSAAWVLALYGIFFQPLPAVLAAVLSFVAAQRYNSTAAGARRKTFGRAFAGRLSEEKLRELITGDALIDTQPNAHDVTAVVCDLANKTDLTEELAPNEYASVAHAFLERAAEVLRKSGAYIHAADGEGVLALFGYPLPDEAQAEKAASAALELTEVFATDTSADADNKRVHVGISSGTVVVGNTHPANRDSAIFSGEPLELARRFCIANRSYGSRILIGPKTFARVSEIVVARPIDFLSGMDARDRLEVYEVLSLATAAKPEEIARRDSFWNGVVYYREKRWGEAYAAFQQAAAANGKEDGPVQLYLRRIEPLLLHLADAPAVSEPTL